MPLGLCDLLNRLEFAIRYKCRLREIPKPLPILHPVWYSQRDLEHAEKVGAQLFEWGLLD